MTGSSDDARKDSAERSSVLVGLMSGTSADGISAAVSRFDSAPDGSVASDLLAFRNFAYTPPERERLLRALEVGSPVEYCRINFDLGEWLARAAVSVIADAGVERRRIRAIASHGHTVWHEPGHSTWQLGEAAVIAERTGLDVIADFRVRDVAAGGQGAPLVAMADALLFSSPSQWRALQNLGGIGNVTVLPPGGVARSVRAFDTGPGCAVIDGATRSLFPDLPFDEGGAIARRGRAIESVVNDALKAPYFAAPPPKSTGRELFSRDYINRFIDACRNVPDTTAEDVVSTAVALTARSIALAYRTFIPEPIAEVILSGGGASNPALVDAITQAVAPMKVGLFRDVFFDGEAKEAVAFALLGYLFLERRAGNIASATGARGPRILGKLVPA
ncbi:MAG: anhydro-N-acetylmuramic acid kinase [Gemmatimonadaceae bacterium]